MTTDSRWSVYIVRCSDGSLYTGIATDVARRIREHEAGPKGSKYLRGRGPLQLVFQREVGDQSRAATVELQIKRLRRPQKQRLILGSDLPNRLNYKKKNLK